MRAYEIVRERSRETATRVGTKARLSAARRDALEKDREQHAPLWWWMYGSRETQREFLEIARMREELRQLRADVLSTMADAKLSAAQAKDTEREAELTQQERETIQKIF